MGITLCNITIHYIIVYCLCLLTVCSLRQSEPEYNLIDHLNLSAEYILNDEANLSVVGL